MSRMFFTADLHFGHQAIIEYCKRPFSSVDEMDEVIIARWNEVVSCDDTVFVLGDYAMGNRNRGLQYLRRMTGTKVLIHGNHDRLSPVNNNAWKYQREYLNDTEGNELFVATYDSLNVSLPSLRKNGPNKRVLLSHYPYTGDHTQYHKDRYSQFREPDTGMSLIHGHIHDDGWVQRSPAGSVMINVGVDVYDFTPVEASELHRLILDFDKSSDNSWAPALKAAKNGV